jgi:hypothetical protein
MLSDAAREVISSGDADVKRAIGAFEHVHVRAHWSRELAVVIPN